METARLILDRLRESDREDYFYHISHDQKVLETFVCRYAEKLEDYDFSSYLAMKNLFAIRLKETERLIGILLFFDETEDSCEIGYGIGSAYWNRGYATEAVGRFIAYCLDERGFQTVFASFFPGNDASRRVMEKCGMRYSRFSEKEFSYLGIERDLIYYAVTKKPVTFQAYRENRYQALCDFLIALNRDDRTHINWNWARFEWMMGHPEFDQSLSGSIGLWLAGERVVGAAVYDMYFGEAFCGVLPGYEELYPEVLDYAYRKLRDDAGLGAALCDGCAREIEAARAAGFAPTEQTETVMSLDLTELPEAALPEGLRLLELDQTEDAEALAWLFWQGFDHGQDRAVFEKTEQGSARPRRHFNKNLSLAAATADGEPVAFCGLWYCDETDYAYVEPVCTIPPWRGRGAAKALLSEALRRARALGAKRAYVISDMAFYEKLGFHKDRQYTFYWKA